MAESTVAAGFARALLDLAVSKGASRQLLLERAQIDPDAVLDQDDRIPLASYLALMNAGADLCNEPALALQFGEAYSATELSIVGLICKAAKDMAEAFVQTNRYARLMIDADEAQTTDWFELVRNEDGTWLKLTSSIYVEHPRLTEAAFARCIHAVARDFSDVPYAKEVHFTHEEPSYRAEFDRVFNVPVVFNSDKNALLIDETFMSLKLSSSNRYVFGVLSKHADALLDRLERSKTVRGQVESLLVPILHTGDVSMELIARKMGLSRQTLYRRLKAEGMSYGSLLDELRHKMALHYLNGNKASVNEVAYLVGFSQPSAFSRAFKRWTGTSPGKACSPKIEK